MTKSGGGINGDQNTHCPFSVTELSSPFLPAVMLPLIFPHNNAVSVIANNPTGPLFRDDDPHECQNGTFHLGLVAGT